MIKLVGPNGLEIPLDSQSIYKTLVAEQVKILADSITRQIFEDLYNGPLSSTKHE